MILKEAISSPTQALVIAVENGTLFKPEDDINVTSVNQTGNPTPIAEGRRMGSMCWSLHLCHWFF